MKKLLIVESPAKIKTISKFLPKEFKVMSTVGHIKDLPPKKIGVTINDGIEIEYDVLENKKKVIQDLVKEAKTADHIYLAPDPDREGEIIAWHAEQEVNKVADQNKISRITFNEITKNAIINAIENPSQIDLKKVSAQQARRVLDRWVGYEVSPILWRKISKGLSAGRVQSVALRLICDREDSIRAFIKEEYWSIEAKFKDFDASLIKINNKDFKLKNKAETEETKKWLEASEYKIESIVDKKRLRKPYAPFMTSSLQQAAFNSLGLPVKKTMELAQKLYEGVPLADKSTPVALITYMRTDSLRLSENINKQIGEYLNQNFSKKYIPSSPIVYGKKNEKSQDAHEAIRPINVEITPEMASVYLPKDMSLLYELIWRRTVASQMKPAEYAQRQVNITAKNKNNIGQFRANGSTLIFDGFLKVYAHDEEELDKKNVKLPNDIEESEELKLKKIESKQHFTQPPARYTEASLVKELEKEGIGRPSTYATILGTIRAREYTSLDTKKRFIPTELGMRVTKTLKENLPKIMDFKFTANMEEDLDKIAQGELERDKVLLDFYGPFKESLEEFAGQKIKSAEPTDIECPECKKNNLVIRFGKNGEFLGCAEYPECNFTSQFKRNEEGKIELIKSEDNTLEEKCPKCEKNLRIVKGKFGTFTACSGYPECNYIKQEKAWFKCPNCESDIVKRSYRGGKFWGCGGYPKCKFAVFDELIEESCKTCNKPYLGVKNNKNGTAIFCIDKSCESNKKN